MSQPSVLWSPSEALLENSQMGRFLERVRQENPEVLDYPALHRWSTTHWEDFWKLWLSESAIQYEGDDSVVYAQKSSRLGGRFFPKVTLNFAENLLRHQSEAPAIHALNECGNEQMLTYVELREQVRRFQYQLLE